MAFLSRVLDVLFPPKCAFCGKLLRNGEEDVCAVCLRDLPGMGEKEKTCDFLTGVTAPYSYEGLVRQALLRYKFQGVPARGAAFGRRIAEDLLRRGMTDFDVITWVPLSRKRERKRGYDQARILAEAAAERLGVGAEPLLRKVRDVPPQSRQTSPEARRANISGCYEALDGAAGKRILVIDDIVTTGSTLSECARVLMLAGAEKVRGAALACVREKE